MHSVDHPRPSRQRGPHNDASMLDGDSAHGNPGEPAGDEWAVDTDTDVVDQGAEDELEDAVADPIPVGEDEIDAFEAGAEPDSVTSGPPVKVAESDEDEYEGEADEDEGGDEEDQEEEEEFEEEEDAEEESATGVAAEATVLDTELDRAMDRTSTDPANPTSHPLAARETTPPVEGYDALTIPQVLAKVEGFEVGQLNAVIEYERAHRNRKTLVSKLTRLTSEA